MTSQHVKRTTLLGTVLLTLAAARATAAGPVVATGLSSFEGIEEPAVVYHPATKTFTNDSYKNITDQGNGVIRFSLRYAPDQWDGDRTTTNDDRQRAEIKGLGPHQKPGQTFEYSFDFRTDPAFIGTSSFCHVFQLKATDGDNGAPLVTLSLKSGNKGQVQVWSGTAANSTAVRTFTWTADTWIHADIRITTADDNTGSVLASIDGDPFAGLTKAPVFRPDATDYRPKWGLYRGINTSIHVGEDYVEDRNVTAVQVVPEPALLLAAPLGFLLRRPRRRAAGN